MTTCQGPDIKIAPPSNNRIYLGVYTGDGAPAQAADAFARKSGTEVDYEIIFMDFANLSPERLRQRIKDAARSGRKIMLKLEPFSSYDWKHLPKARRRLYFVEPGLNPGDLNKRYRLEMIIAGELDNVFRQIAEVIRDSNEAVFVSPVGHEMNTNWYPWARLAELYIRAYQHAQKVMSGIACNITYVWNPNVGMAEKYNPDSNLKTVEKSDFAEFDENKQNQIWQALISAGYVDEKKDKDKIIKNNAVIQKKFDGKETNFKLDGFTADEQHKIFKILDGAQKRRYIDWVMADGYNWGGTQPTADIFSASIAYFQTLPYPFGIGEFGCGANRIECLPSFIDYSADPKNKIRIIYYFNMDKKNMDRGEENWAVKTPKEWKAWQEAILRNKPRFEEGTETKTSEEFARGLIFPPSPPPQKNLPPAFAEKVENYTPRYLMNRNATEIDLSRSRQSGNQEDIAEMMLCCLKMLPCCNRSKLATYSFAGFQESIIQWMFYRENGVSKNDLLTDSLLFEVSPYWKTKVAFLIVTGSPDADQIKYLQEPKKMRYAQGKKLTLPLSREVKYDLLIEIYDKYGIENRLEGTDPLIRAEMQLQLALLAKNEETANHYFMLAENGADRMQEELNDAFKKFRTTRLPVAKIPNALVKTINARLHYLKPGASMEDHVINEVIFYQGQVKLLKAQVILQRAGRMDDQKTVFLEMDKAYKLLMASIPYLVGMHYKEVKRQAAECLIRMGFIAKDLEGARDAKGKSLLDFSDNKMLKELQAWEIKTFGKDKASFRSYETFFRTARLLIRGIPNESVLEWVEDYRRTLEEVREEEIERIKKLVIPGKNKKKLIEEAGKWETPVWLKQIEAYSTIWEGKGEGVEISERRKGHPTQYLAQQRSDLEKVKETLDKIRGLDPDIQADVITSMLNAIAQQGFIALTLADRKNAGDLFEKIEKDLRGILNQTKLKVGKPGDPGQQTRAEINLLLANIAYVEAGNKDIASERKERLREAQEYTNAATHDTKILHGPLLSYAYQVYGEILLLQKKVKPAEEKVKRAIEIFPQNYAARAVLVDIISQQGEHAQAIEEYRKLLIAIRPTFPHSTLRTRIELGLAEAEMREDENYNAKNIANLEDYVLGVFKKEAPGSFVVSRALMGLLEGYGTNEDLHDRIALICSILLGREDQIDEGAKQEEETKRLTNVLVPLRKLAAVYPRLKAILYLKLTEALTWRKRFKEAETALSEIPQDLLNNVIRKDSELFPWYKLVGAELAMSAERKAPPIMRDDLARAVLEQPDLDSEPDLMSRFILDQVVGLSYEKKFDKVIELVKGYQTIPLKNDPKKRTQLERVLERVMELFKEKGRYRSAFKFKFNLWMKLATAHSWLAGRLKRKGKNEEAAEHYNAAIRELKKIYDETKKEDKTLERSLPRDLQNLFQAEVYVNTGDIFKSKWAWRDFRKAETYYKLAVGRYKNRGTKEMEKLSKSDLLTLAKAYFGLGEVYRYGKNPKNYEGTEEMEDYKKSLENYREALKIAERRAIEPDEIWEELTDLLPEKSEERIQLLTRIYLGMAKLEQQEGNRRQAMIYFKKAEKNAEKVPGDEELLHREIENTRAFLFERFVEVKSETFAGFPKEGRRQQEHRLTVKMQFPAENVTPVFGAPTPQLRIHNDSSAEGNTVSIYAGGSWRMLESLNTGSWFFNVEALRKLNEDRGETVFFRRPEYIFSASGGFKYLSLIASAEFASKPFVFTDTDNSYFLKLAGSPHPNLQVGLVGNCYPIFYSGTRELRYDLYLTPEFNIDAADLDLVNDFDVLKFNAFLRWPFLQVGDKFPDGVPENQKYTERYQWSLLNAAAGLGADAHLGSGFRLSGNLLFVNQGEDYRYFMSSLALGW